MVKVGIFIAILIAYFIIYYLLNNLKLEKWPTEVSTEVSKNASSDHSDLEKGNHVRKEDVEDIIYVVESSDINCHVRIDS